MYLSICLSVCLPVCLSICLSIYLPIYLSIYLSFFLSYLSIYLPTYLSIYLSIYLIDLSIHPSIHLILSYLTLSIYLSVYLQAWKGSYFATLPQFLSLTTSKTKQFCETSSILELDTIENEAILRDFVYIWTWQHQKRSNSARRPSNMESWVQSWRSRTNAFCDFSSPPV